MASLTEYEKTRLENIRRNQEKLAALNLNVNELRLSLQKRKGVKGYKVSPSKKPKKENAPVVIRRSLRARGIPPDAVLSKGLDDDLPTPDRHQPSFPSSYSSPPTPPPYKRETPFSMKEVYEGKSDEGEFKKSVIHMCENTPLDRIRGRKKPRDLEDYSFKLEKMRLFIGNTKRAVDVISISSRTTTTLESSLMTAIPCRFAAHPCLRGSLAGATGGGQVYLWTTD